MIIGMLLAVLIVAAIMYGVVWLSTVILRSIGVITPEEARNLRRGHLRALEDASNVKGPHNFDSYDQSGR